MAKKRVRKKADYPWIVPDLRPLAVPIGDLKPDPQNARTHDAANVKAIASSLREYGQIKPLVVNRRNSQIVAGNGTLAAARSLNWSHLAVVWVEQDESKQHGLSIADNRTAELAEWDDDVLAVLLGQVEEETPDLYADLLLADLRVDEPFDDSQAPEPQIDRAAELQAEWQTELGQLWEIPGKAGVHRLLCGDCREIEDVGRVCVEKVNGCFTSPPYAEQRKKQYGGVPAGKYVVWWEAVQAGVKSVLADDGSFFVNIKPHSEGGERVLYVLDLVLAMRRGWGWRYIDEFCWERVGAPGDPKQMRRFRNTWESVHWFASGKFTFFPEHVMRRSSGSVVHSPGKPSLSGMQGQGGGHIDGATIGDGWAHATNRLPVFAVSEALGHSAVFPLGLPSFFQQAYSEEGASWLDPFLGSGTTMVAAEQLGRICYGIEIEPKYVAVALQRMKDMGLEPRLTV